MMRAVALVACLLVAALPAAAQEVGPDARARAHFEAGRAFYSIGNYEEALREFLTGYQIVPKPKFLLNIAQSYRKMGQLANARAMCLRYLAEESPEERARFADEVNRLMHEIDEALANKETPPPVAPPATLVVPRAAPAPSPVIVRLDAPAPPPKKSFMRRHWWIVPVSAVVAVGVAVGVYFGTRPGVDCSVAGFGCVDAQTRRP
jgi:hypothetical protein